MTCKLKEIVKARNFSKPVLCSYSFGVVTLLWVKWEDETPTPKVRDLESFGTPECLKLDRKAQNTSH